MYDILTVYHGGTDVITVPDVAIGRPDLDFGPGFYVTDIYSQASSWAKKMATFRECEPIINIYHLHQKDVIDAYKHKIFTTYDREWLEFIVASRLGEQPWDGLDYIEGGVADDRVLDTVRLFMAGFISAEDALKRLQYFKPANQICLLNQELVNSHLEFVKSENYFYE